MQNTIVKGCEKGLAAVWQKLETPVDPCIILIAVLPRKNNIAGGDVSILALAKKY